MSTAQGKLAISLSSAALLALVSLPATYKVTNSVFGNLINKTTGCPNYKGIILHALVFFVVTYLSMGGARVPSGIKLKHTIYGTLIYFFVTNPVTYKFVASLLGNWVASASGCPTPMGIMLHALVYTAILYGVMYLP